jgi:hypothetical protein
MFLDTDLRFARSAGLGRRFSPSRALAILFSCLSALIAGKDACAPRGRFALLNHADSFTNKRGFSTWDAHFLQPEMLILSLKMLIFSHFEIKLPDVPRVS